MTESSVWTKDQLADPHRVKDKARRVRQMFGAIAPSYDLNNRLHSLGRDQSWRRAAVRMAQIQERDRILDVACGTGDLAMAFADAGASLVLGIDFTNEMLAIAQTKAQRSQHQQIHYYSGDAIRLPVADAKFDVVSIAFGIRNVADPYAAIRQFYRVLKPGGRLVILEFGLPTNQIARGLYHFYFQHLLPRTATLIAADRTGAYKYLPRSVDRFIDADTLVKMMNKAGFLETTAHSLTLGIAMLYRGMKPPAQPR